MWEVKENTVLGSQGRRAVVDRGGTVIGQGGMIMIVMVYILCGRWDVYWKSYEGWKT